MDRNLAPDQSTTFTFPPYPSPLANYSICAYTDLAFDSHFSNDTELFLYYSKSPAYDVTVIEIIEPVSQTILFNEATVKVRIKNLGSYWTLMEVPIAYKVGGTPTAQETWHGGPLNTGDEAEFTFNHKYSFGYAGYYYLCVFTDLLTDGYQNDTICKKVEETFTLVGEIDENGVGLSQNAPNPADESTQILYYLPQPGEVEFTLINYLGQVMLTETSKGNKGENQIEIDTRYLPSGLYYYYIQYDDKRYMRKMLIAH